MSKTKKSMTTTRSKVIKTSLWVNDLFPYSGIFSTFSNGKTDTVNMLYMVRDTKVSTVTPMSDPPLRGQRSFFNYTRLGRVL